MPAEGAENEKDAATEKAEVTTNGHAEEKDASAVTHVENGGDESINVSKVSEAGATSPTSETAESNKKPKKEKVKKKWSFRSISFSKKDKQKPAKKEEEKTNGEIEKVPEEVCCCFYIFLKSENNNALQDFLSFSCFFFLFSFQRKYLLCN